MSRVGKKEIIIPAGTEVSVVSTELIVKGKGGTLKKMVHPAVKVEVSGQNVTVNPANNSRLAKALWGTYAAHVRNMISGVNTPFIKKLQIEGIGYKAEMQGTNLKMALGFSHPVIVAIPSGVTVLVEKNIVTVSGSDKEVVGQFAASVRSIKKPEPYKGKGIRYEGEVVRQKQGKKVAG
ncbi:MAG: 50S ribosomal protein L6 [Candidatus Pacebacteria bacterium]|nr:50S ribosomal protein L6 [Candidatus Paceibacterota bacterium]